MSLSNIKKRAAAQGGFSLIELLVVVLIIGILAAIMIPRFLGQRDNANNSQAQTTVRNAASAAESFYQKNGEAYGTAVDLADEIQRSEPSVILAGATQAALDPAGTTAASATAGDNADPDRIWVATTDATLRSGTATICAASKGDRAYCIRLRGDDSSQYGADDTVSNAEAEIGALTAPNTGNWNG